MRTKCAVDSKWMTFFRPCAIYIGIFFMSLLESKAETTLLQVKSFIAPVNLLDAGQWDADAKSCETVMAAIVSCGTKFGENPSSGAKESKDFRLWSQLQIDTTCEGNKILNWDIKPVENAFGPEFYFISTGGDISKPLFGKPSLKGTSNPTKVNFSYRLRGQPNDLGIKLMNQVKQRSCSYIWHELNGTLQCEAGKPSIKVDISGSAFPSHSAWSNEKLIKSIPQGPFKNLWKCNSLDPTSVQ